MIHVDYNKYVEDISSDVFNDFHLHSFFKDIATFLFDKSQIELYVIDVFDKDEIDKENLDYMRDFGVGVTDFGILRRSYILYVNPDDVKTSLDNFIYDVPSGVEPTHVVIMDSDRDTISKTFDIISEYYPNIISMQAFKSTDVDMSEFVLKDSGLDRSLVLFVNDYVYSIAKMDRYSAKYIVKVEEICKEIHSKYPNKILIYSGNPEYRNIYAMLVSEMHLIYNQRFYMSEGRVSSICSNLMRSIFDKDTQLMEEFIDSFNKLPKILIELQYSGFSYNAVRNRMMSLEIDSVCIDCSDEDMKVKHTVSNTSDLTILSIFDYYDIDTIDGCALLKDKIMSLYRILDLDDDTVIDVTDLIIFKEPGLDDIRIGYVRDFRTTMKVTSIHTELGSCDRTLEYNKIKMCVPPSFFLTGVIMCERLFKSIVPNFTRDMCYTSFKPRKYGSIMLSNTSRFDEDFLKYNIRLSTLGLFSRYGLKHREGFSKHYVKLLGVPKMRSTLDCFGGVTPHLVESIILGN